MEKLINIEKIRAKSSRVLIDENITKPAEEAANLIKLLSAKKNVKLFKVLPPPKHTLDAIEKAKKEIEKSLENYKKNIPKVLENNKPEKRSMFLIASVLGIIALFGLAYGVIKESKTLLGADVFP